MTRFFFWLSVVLVSVPVAADSGEVIARELYNSREDPKETGAVIDGTVRREAPPTP